jgi:arginine N-succinyltransferase
MKNSKSFPSFLVREVNQNDLAALLELSSTPGMFNLPSQPDRMKSRITQATQSFRGRIDEIANTKYVFVAEEVSTGKIVATSMIAGKHGTEDSPHYYFKVGTENRFSQDIQTGFIHGTLLLQTQEDGPSELGGLVVHEDYRNHIEKVGRQIFVTRFLYLHLHPKKFQQELLAELLPPLNKKGNSPLWEALGRRFTNLDYWEADALSAQNKNFIFDLFPQEKIYTTFLPADARNAIGRVSPNTEPVLHLLKRIGFTYRNEIDPFDGGPHLRAMVSDISLLKKIQTGVLKVSFDVAPHPVSGLITAGTHRGNGSDEFRAVHVSGEWKNKEFWLNPDIDYERIRLLLKLQENDSIIFMPYF